MESEFCVKIDFQKGTENPERIFQAMSDLIQSFKQIDQDLSSSIALKLESKLILQDIEVGSLQTRLRSLLESIDDNGLKELDWKKLVGAYLVKGKYQIIKFLEEKQQVNDRSQIEELRQSLIQLAQETNIKQLPFYSPVSEARLLKDLQELGNSMLPLRKEDIVNFSGGGMTIKINKDFSVTHETIEEILTERVLTGKYEIILKVKKPDYLGQSMWEFKHEGKIVQAKILHGEWLDKFHNKQIFLGPGDSIRVLVEVRVNYDKYGDVVSSHYTIFEVKEIISLPKEFQHSLL